MRLIGRRNQTLNAAAVELCERLAESSAPAARWNGKQALRELTGPLVRRQLAAKAARKPRAARRPVTTKSGGRE